MIFSSDPGKLGFGLMRLPKKDGQIDIPAVCELADAFLDAGFRYFDTAWAYPGAEDAFRLAVAERYPRDRYLLADKMLCGGLHDGFGPQDMFEQSLQRCGVDYFDVYLLHSLKATKLPPTKKYGCWEFCRRMKEEGKIRNFGFSFHGTPDLLDSMLDEYPFVDVVQLQINYTDMEDSVILARANYEVCRKHGKDIIVMEPVKGGILARLPAEAEALYRALDPDASPASYALRFPAGMDGVKVVLSGMNTLGQIRDNAAVFSPLRPLTDNELAVMTKVKDILLSVPTIPCTNCRYCVEGCPKAIRIPDIITAYNLYLTFGDHPRPHLYYGDLLDEGSGRAGDCLKCGKCESTCPQHINIIRHLREASALLDR